MYVPMLLNDFLDRAVKLYGSKKAVVNVDGREFTYSEVNERVNQLSRGLIDLGVEKGDRVAYLAPNTVEMYEGFYGVFQTGAVMVPLNTRLTPNDYKFILNHSETKVLFCDQELYHQVEPIRDELTTVEHIVLHYADGSSEGINYNEWLGRFDKSSFERPELDENDVCSLLYTSGTTGNPKGVMLTHRNNYMHAFTMMHHLRVTDADVYLHILPMFHVNGWGAPFYYTANGATNIMLRKVDAEKIFELVGEHKVSSMHMAPTVLNAIIQHFDKTKKTFDHDTRIVIAGSAPPPAFVTKVEEDIGWEFIQVYGMTESSPLSTASIIRPHLELEKDEKYRIKAKAGIPLVGCDVKVVNDSGEEVAWNGKEIGEVVTRSHGVMKGYWKNEEATMEAIRDGWLYTGDMGIVDEYGTIDIVDRKKDVIISGGENISSIEVEGVLYDHPDILEAAVVALPHDKWGETPHAFVVLKEGIEMTEEDVIQFSRENLAHFKAVTGVTFVPELPKTASGKIQKVHLRNQAWEDKGLSKDGRFVN